ncbi:MAG: dolichyl-diphosphooligosaccharide--protein glycosyltransferase subunit STT3, partial [Aquificaceae bacterium]|nr:dolichyl-diphosphooligosaccharide--protein glycosyltransferase subunit STT3 [Aquificaceae bacterium]
MQEGKPLIQNPDGFLFARLIRDGFINPDNLRYFPDGIEYPFFPMIGFLGHSVYRITGAPPEWIGTFMDIMFSSLFVIPMFLFLNKLGYPIVGILASSMATMSPFYLDRTEANLIDTDSLNLFFPFMNAYIFLQVIKEGPKHVYFLALLVNNLLYYWWYAHFEFILASFFGFTILTLWERNFKSLYYSLLVLITFSAISYPLFGHIPGLDAVYRVSAYFVPHELIEGSEEAHRVLQTIAEQANIGFFQSYNLFIVGKLYFVISILWFFRLWRWGLLLTPFVILSILAYHKGNIRLFMYVVPLVSIGFSFFLWDTYRLFSNVLKNPKLKFVAPLYIFTAFSISQPLNYIIFRKPEFYFYPETWKDFQKLKELTPEGSAIFTWWDWGYAIQYYSGRATFHDGGSQGTKKTELIARALLSPEEEAHKIITLLSSKDTESSRRNVYVLITSDMLLKLGAIRQVAGLPNSYGVVVFDGCKEPACQRNVSLDEGVYREIYNQKDTLDIEFSRYIEYKDGRKVLDYSSDKKGFVLVYVKEKEKEKKYYISQSMLNTILIELLLFPDNQFKYFELVYRNFPDFV